MTSPWWHLLVSFVVAPALLWLALIVALFVAARRSPDQVTLREALRLAPDVVRLVRRLGADPTIPRGARWRLWILLGYLLLPVDVVPDFIPVVGWADDVVVIALVLRSVVRVAGPEALERHWPGTSPGLEVVRRLARVSDSPARRDP